METLNTYEAEDLKKERMRSYIGTSVTYYMDKRFDMQNRNTKMSWNWPAFFVPFYWMAYRKMYVEVIAGNILCYLWYLFNALWTGILCRLTQNYNTVFLMFFCDLLFQPAIAVFANHYYLRRIEKLVEAESGLSEYSAEEQLRRKGGVSIWGVIILLIFNLVIGLLF